MIKASDKTKNPQEKEIKSILTEALSGFNKENEENSINLRPQTLKDYIGQEKVVSQLELIIKSAKLRETLPEHLLFYGQPGLGKTTLASLISNELNVELKIVSAPALQKIGDIVSLLVNQERSVVLFIDEIHRLKAPIEETLYTAMEDMKVDLVIGKGQGLNTTRIDLKPFILIGATTQIGKLSKPLRDRFPSIFRLEPYNLNETLQLIDRNSKLLDIKLDKKAKILICERCRGIPRIANNIMKRFVDLKTVHKIEEICETEAKEFLTELGIYEKGLTKTDLLYLKSLSNGSLGLKTLSGILLEEVETLELVTEPYLINLGFLEKNSSGRNLTQKGRKYVEKLEKEQSFLFE